MTNLTKLVVVVFLVIAASSVRGSILQQNDSDDCILRIYQSGRSVILDGTILSEPHGEFLFIPGCKYPIVVEYPSDLNANEKEQERIPELRRDSNLESMNSQLKENPSKGVEVSLFGRLDVAKPMPENATVKMGFVFDKSGKYLRIYGFGSPVPAYKYRLVLIQVNSVSTGNSK